MAVPMSCTLSSTATLKAACSCSIWSFAQVLDEAGDGADGEADREEHEQPPVFTGTALVDLLLGVIW